MKRIASFTLFVLVVAVVVLLSDWRADATPEKSRRGNRLAARTGEYEGDRVLIKKSLEAPSERMVTVPEGVSSDTQPAERTRPLGWRVLGYVFFLVVAFVASALIGGSIAVGLEYLVGWPDTWWL